MAFSAIMASDIDLLQPQPNSLTATGQTGLRTCYWAITTYDAPPLDLLQASSSQVPSLINNSWPCSRRLSTPTSENN